jgi:transposase-like protein
VAEKRDVAAAKRFFGKAMKNHGPPRAITLDAYAFPAFAAPSC